jgi:hypothetical protein
MIHGAALLTTLPCGRPVPLSEAPLLKGFAVFFTFLSFSAGSGR